jgi:hypothetical protein
LLLTASCEIGDNPRFFTEELFAVTEDISGDKILPEQSVIQLKPRALFSSKQIALV